MAGEQPRIRLEWGSAADSLGGVLRAALDLLDHSDRIRLVGPDEPADVVHTVGEATPGPVGAASGAAAHRVHTVQAVPLRRGRLGSARWWARRERHRVGTEVTWLAHGRVAAQLLVASGAVPGEQVRWLPLVAPLECQADGPVDRASVRAGLGVPPGVVLVLECAPLDVTDTVGDWARPVAADRRDVMTLRCAVRVPGACAEPGSDLAPKAWTGGPSFAELLAAADLFVAAQRGLTAANPGVAAVAAGVPVVAVTTDSTAELVRSGRNGFVVPPDPGAVAEAVRAYLDGELPIFRAPSRSAGAGRGSDPVLEELARGLLRAYHCTLIHRGVHPSGDRGPVPADDHDTVGARPGARRAPAR